jgi:Ca2+/H+ antiporter, TMEM165/GDT1 family
MALKFDGINRTFLTIATLFLLVLVSKINCDLAPKEEDDDDAPQGQLDLTKDVSLTTHKPTENVSNLGFIHAFIASFSVIIVSEIGDKTFFIAAIMSMVSDYYIRFFINQPLTH